MHRVLFSSAQTHWATPSAVYAALDHEFHFDFDPCPLDGQGSLFRGYLDDGLAISWAGRRVFCNPPYGPSVDRWLRKGREADVAVFLLPARTDTRWWHSYAMTADEIRFLRGRLRFSGTRNTAPFPSCLIIFRT